jgi:hypothetical protein
MCMQETSEQLRDDFSLTPVVWCNHNNMPVDTIQSTGTCQVTLQLVAYMLTLQIAVELILGYAQIKNSYPQGIRYWLLNVDRGTNLIYKPQCYQFLATMQF